MNTPNHPDPSPSEIDLHRLVDGQLSAEEAARTLAWLQGHPEAQARVDAWRAQRLALRQLHADWSADALPESQLSAAARVREAHQAWTRTWRLGGLAASLLLAFTAGWMAHRPVPGEVSPALAAGGSAFVRQATYAYRAFAPEVRHPVEVTADEHVHLTQWLSKRLGHPLKVPDLHEQGFALMGGRLLPAENGVRAQFMYQDADGQRVTLYLGAWPLGEASQAAQETAFRWEQQDAVGSFYWVDRGVGYALSGTLPRQRLMDLAHSVYPQL